MGEEANKEPAGSAPRKSRAWIWWLVLLVGALAVLGSAVALVFGWHEPKYSDKPLSYWLAELNGTNYIRRDIAADALAKIGEPALEPLRFALRKERSFVYELRDRVWKIAPLAIQQHIPKPWNVDDLQYNACVALAVMGPAAVSVAPELVQTFTNPSPAVISRATYALNKMGTNAHPALLAGLDSPDLKVVTQCRNLLQQAKVPLKQLVPMYDVYLKRILSAKSLTREELSEALSLLNLSRAEAIKNLQPLLTNGDGVYRCRVAILLSYLQVVNAEVTATLVKEFGSMSLIEQRFVATALENQRPHLQPYFKELQKMAADPQLGVAVPIARVLEREFADSAPKWALIDRYVTAGSTDTEWPMVLSLLTTNLRTGLELAKAHTYLLKLLNHPNHRAQQEVLFFMSREPHSCLPLLPDVERYHQNLTTNNHGHMMSAPVANTLRSLKQAQQMMNTSNAPRQNTPSVP